MHVKHLTLICASFDSICFLSSFHSLILSQHYCVYCDGADFHSLLCEPQDK